VPEHKSTKGTWHFLVLDGNCQVRAPGLPRYLSFPAVARKAQLSQALPLCFPPPNRYCCHLCRVFLRVAPPIIESEVSEKESAGHNDENGGDLGVGVWELTGSGGNSGVSAGQLPARPVNLMTGIHGHFPLVTAQKFGWPLSRLLWALSFVIYHNFRTPSVRRPARNSFNCPTQNLVAISVRPSGLCGNFSLWLKPKEQTNSKIETFLPLRFSASQGK